MHSTSRPRGHRGVIAIAGLTAAALVAAGSLQVAHAQIDLRIGNGDFNISVWPECGRVGKIVDAATVRQHARKRGFRGIRNITLVKRRYGKSKICGFYRARARKDGRRYRLYANASNARLLSARVIGEARKSHRVDAKEARHAMRQAGFRKIRNLRKDKRGNDTYWIARAEKNGADFRVLVDARSGKVARTARLGGKEIDRKQARHAMRQAGFRKIRDLRKDKRGKDTYWIARAEKNGADFRVLVDAGNGKVVRTAKLGGDTLNEQQARRNLRRSGYRDIRNLRRAKRKGEAFWIARARKNDREFRVTVRLRHGKIVMRAHQVGPDRASAEDVRKRMRQDGYRHIDNLRFVKRGRNAHYVAVAWKNGIKWRVRARARTGEPFGRKRVGGRISADAAHKRLLRAGYRNIDKLRWRDDGRAGHYVARASLKGTRYHLVARGADAKIVDRKVLRRRRVEPKVVRGKIAGAGFSAIDKIEFADGAYVVVAWKDGVRYRLRARARDGDIVDRNRIGGRIGEDRLRQALGKAGYDRIGGVRFVDDGREGYYTAIAWHNERKYRLYARAESGKTYRRVLVDRRISEEQLRRRLRARGFEKVEDIELKKHDDAEDEYLATVWKNGDKYRLHARASDGTPLRRLLLDPRASEDAVRKHLRDAGYDDIHDLRFAADRVGGHFEATARKDDRTLHLHLRANDGSVYRQRVEAK